MNILHRWYCRSAGWRETVGSRLLPWVIGDRRFPGELLEIGPGPGLTTDVLRRRAERVTAVEVDARLAADLARRLRGTNVAVVHADATRMPFASDRFDAAVCCTMLHHVPSAELQDRLLVEILRVLRPGAVLYGSDSETSLLFRLVHVGDTLVPVDSAGFAERLRRAGFVGAKVGRAKRAFRFAARKPCGGEGVQ